MKNLTTDRWRIAPLSFALHFRHLRRNSYLDDPCYNTKSVDKNPQNDSGAVLPTVVRVFREYFKNERYIKL